jgi:signal transduction histidine kinase
MSTDISERIQDLRARQERLLSDVGQQVQTLSDDIPVPLTAVIASVNDKGLLDALAIDRTVRRRSSPENLARAIDRAIQMAQQPALAVLRAVGLDSRMTPSAEAAATIERAAGQLGDVLSSFTEEAPPRDLHAVSSTGVRATASYGVVRSVACDPAWLARSTDVEIGEEVVAVCRRAALASDADLGQVQA